MANKKDIEHTVSAVPLFTPEGCGARVTVEPPIEASLRAIVLSNAVRVADSEDLRFTDQLEPGAIKIKASHNPSASTYDILVHPVPSCRRRDSGHVGRLQGDGRAILRLAGEAVHLPMKMLYS